MSLPARPDVPAAAFPLSGMARYRCRHVTRTVYTDEVETGQLIAHLLPRPHPAQHLTAASLTISPAPAVRQERLDWFGNPTLYAEILTPHRDLTVTLDLDISVANRPLPAPDLTPRLADACRMAAADATLQDFLFPSTRVPLGLDSVRNFTAPLFADDPHVLTGALRLTEAVFTAFTFDPAATSVSTPIGEVMTLRRGVCQDFAHVMTAAVRGLGLPARYVSGYLRTLPPPGQEKLQGSDASHAWVQVWAGPGAGWIDLDPTNNRPADRDHITLGWGRDYDDIAPLRGVITGGGSQTVYVAVDVEEMPDEERPDTERAGSEAGL